jgi:hypothetical protein
MKTVRNLALAVTAAGALALGSAAFAQEQKPADTAAQPDAQQKHEHKHQKRAHHKGQHQQHKHDAQGSQPQTDSK